MIDCKYPVGNGINAPQMANLGATSLEKKVFYSDPVPSTDSGPNLSAKFKNPRVKQSIPDAGRGQYE